MLHIVDTMKTDSVENHFIAKEQHWSSDRQSAIFFLFAEGVVVTCPEIGIEKSMRLGPLSTTDIA